MQHWFVLDEDSVPVRVPDPVEEDQALILDEDASVYLFVDGEISDLADVVEDPDVVTLEDAFAAVVP